MSQATLVQVDAAAGRVVVSPNYTGADTTPAVVVERTDDRGETWVPVRGDLADGLWSMLSGTSRSFPDTEAPIGLPVQYRSIKAALDGTLNGTTFNLSATVVIPAPSGCVWFVHPINFPALVSQFVPGDDGGATFGADRGVFFPIGAPQSAADFGTKTSPVVTLARRQRRSGATVTFCARSNSEASDLVTTLGEASIMCVRSPVSHGWGVRYVSIGAIKEAHPTPIQAGAWRYTCAYVEVDRPTVETVQQYGATYDQLAAAYSTYAALAAAYTDYNAQTLAVL